MARPPRPAFIITLLVALFLTGSYSLVVTARSLYSSLFSPVKQVAGSTPEPPVPEVHPAYEEPAKSVGRPLAEALEGLDYAGDLGSYQTFDATLQARLRHERYDDLEGFGLKLNRTKARFPGGPWKLWRFGNTVSACPTGRDGSDAEWTAHLARLAAWSQSHPRSPLAVGILADAWIKYAWKARGSGYARSVPKEGWKDFETRIQQARQLLEQAPAEAHSPLWYSARQTVALGQGWDLKEYDEVFQAAIACEPRYQTFYTQKAYYLLPRWHGRPGEAETFVAQAADRLGGSAGDQVYAWSMLTLENYENLSIWKKAHVQDWPRIKRGLDSVRSEFGTGLRFENACLRAAAYNGDRAMAKASALAIGDQMDPETWNDKEGFLDFRDWAYCRGRYERKS